MNEELMINAINEDAGYKYIPDDLIDKITAEIVTTRDSIDNFKSHHKHVYSHSMRHSTPG